MRGELVAIDLETTGLDPSQDAIIEIGAVRMREGEIIDEYTTLVDPGIPIPAQSTRVTGIETSDVAGAPKIDAVLPAVRDFVRDAVVIGHNVAFDLGFMQRHGVLRGQRSVDTYDLASVLLPGAPRYNLNSLTQQLNIDLAQAHRALADARATALLYWALWQRACALPHNILREIVGAARNVTWDAGAVFVAALQDSVPDRTDGRSLQFGGELPSFAPPLEPETEPQPIDLTNVTRLMGPDGVMRDQPGFEARPAQVEMAHAVTNAFNNRKHLIVEADTGTGKSLAYLVPAITWALQNKKRVVISTNTIGLQDQLLLSDIPQVRTAIDDPFSATVLKGRSNYLCPVRLDSAKRQLPASVDELRILAKVLVWLHDGASGDRSELNLRGPGETVAWLRLSAQDEHCSTHRCDAVAGKTCPFYKARRAAESAHIIIVNHALLVADAAGGGQVIPDYDYLIVDEAHHLEDAITGSLTFHLGEHELPHRFAALGSIERGLLHEVYEALRPHQPEKRLARLRSFIETIGEAQRAASVHVHRLFASFASFLSDAPGRGGDMFNPVRITPQLMARSSYAQVQANWQTLNEFLELLGQKYGQVGEFLHRTAEEHTLPRLYELESSMQATSDYIEDVRQQMQRTLMETDANTISWLTTDNIGAHPVLHAAPLHVGPLVDQYLWRKKASVVLTSATLRASDNFAYFRERLFADEVEALQLASEFDYRKSTLVYVPNDIPEPNERQGYQRGVERAIIELAAALDGRVLVLFTSYAQLRETAQAITPRLALGDIVVYDQSDGSSQQALVDGFTSTEKAVLLGTRRLWEGIDIPGDALSGLVIVRLPFAVPTDPIFASRSETYTNSFQEYAVPDAILRFRQGFGRLIRSKSDRGIVVVMDRRIQTKGYGASFLEALPDCDVRFGPIDSLAEAAQSWLGYHKT